MTAPVCSFAIGQRLIRRSEIGSRDPRLYTVTAIAYVEPTGYWQVDVRYSIGGEEAPSGRQDDFLPLVPIEHDRLSAVQELELSTDGAISREAYRHAEAIDNERCAAWLASAVA